ncbi:MAG: DUF1704 domain-containing protein [Enterobacteriaceae bacterium]|nr:DUF1704 domain-containing protein [Enterobacteriaceae bacterium]
MKKEMKKIIYEIRRTDRKKKNKKDIEPKIKLQNYAKKICGIIKGYENMYSFIEPMGVEGRSFNEEIDFYLIDRKNGGCYSPNFIYPKLHSINSKKLKKKIIELQRIEQKVTKEKNKNLKKIILKTIYIIKAKINILIELKNRSTKEAFKYAKIAYGDIDDDLVRKAKNHYNEKIKFLKKKRKSKVELILEKKEFCAKDIKFYFDLALNKVNLTKKVKVIIKKNVKNISYCQDSFYNSNVIVIPTDRKVNGVKLFELMAHEIGVHALVNILSAESEFCGLNFGRDSEAIQEGFALRNEIEIKKKILGSLYSDTEIKSKPYAILAMKKIKEGSKVGEVYDYIFDLRKKEYLAEGYNELESGEKSSKTTKDVLRRVYRGFYPYYFPKDKIYFEGEFLAKKIEEEKKDIYFLQSKINLHLLSDMIKIGLYPNSIDVVKNINKTREVAKIMWEEHNLLK